MDITVVLLILVIIVSLVFEYINGFHDAANAISMAISTKALSPRYAILYAAVLDFAGALCGTHVAKTIGSGIVSPDSITQLVILCALLGAIIWNLITWWFGLPSSSSHALIGGLLGASLMHSSLLLGKPHPLIITIPPLSFSHPSFAVVDMHNLIDKVLLPMITSPLLGFAVGFLVVLVLLRFLHKIKPEILNKRFRKMQLLSAGFLAFSHGSNDAQKTMGIITLSLITFGALDGKNFDIPLWVICLCATTLAMGTMTGGMKIIKTLSSKVIKMKPPHGFSVEMASASIILTASHFGIPVSTTHITSAAIMGVGSMVKCSAVKWGIVKNIVVAWIFTIPVTIILSGSIYYVLLKSPMFCNCGG
ncbi:MAG: inorganic phosphate transporter [Candidatus Gastranaerophilales bacterium]|nr:inorganic phosphate transporter [Candidatus Gastranaerophilales bacterium]